MSADQLDEISEDSKSNGDSKGGGMLPALLAIILAPLLTVGAMFFVIKANKPEQTIKPQIIEGGQPLDMEPSGEEKFYEIKQLITNLGGPIKSRYINLEVRLEGLAGDFEKVLEMNEHRIRDKGPLDYGWVHLRRCSVRWFSGACSGGPEEVFFPSVEEVSRWRERFNS